jgi:hypothetical protein
MGRVHRRDARVALDEERRIAAVRAQRPLEEHDPASLRGLERRPAAHAQSRHDEPRLAQLARDEDLEVVLGQRRGVGHRAPR